MSPSLSEISELSVDKKIVEKIDRIVSDKKENGFKQIL